MSDEIRKVNDDLRYSVVLTEEHFRDCPAEVGEWSEGDRESASWRADLSADEFAEICNDLYLRYNCRCQGTVGGAGFEDHHATPAVVFADDDEGLQAWVTPWTPSAKAAALEAVHAEPVGVLGFARPVDMLWLPLWGDDWELVVQMLEREFDDKRLTVIDAVSSIDIAAERRAAATQEPVSAAPATAGVPSAVKES